jgi:hypothetical protein
MKAIIVANINAHLEESRSRDEVLIGLVSSLLATKGSDVVVRYVTSVQHLERTFQETEPLLLITNFPPDSTYEGCCQPALRPSFGTVVYSFPADSYYRTKEELAAILRQVSPVRVVVITGAPRNTLTDEDILSVSDSGTVYIVRKPDLFNAPEGYDRAHTAFVLSEVARAIAPPSDLPERENWYRTQAAWQKEQLGQARILILCRSEKIGEAVARGLAMSFSEVPCPLVFLICASIEGAHKHLLDGQIEIVLSVFDIEHWAPIHDAVQVGSDFVVSLALVDAKDARTSLPARTVEITTDPTRRIDAQHLASTIFDGLRQVRSRIQQAGGLSDLQKCFLMHLASGDASALARALRVLTAHHRTVLNTLSRKRGQLKLFLPVGNAQDLGALMCKAALIADLTVFTQLPPTQSRTLHGQSVQIMPLWDMNGVQYGSMIHREMGAVIQRYAPLFASGRVFFYPSQTVIAVDHEHADELMPGSALSSTEPSVRVWQEEALFDQHISAHNIAGEHTVIAEYRRISKIGKAVAALEIPYITNVPADLLDKLLRDNQASLSEFRILTKRLIEDLIESQSDIEGGSILKRFRRELEDGVTKLRENISTSKISAIQQAGGAIITTTFTLAAVSFSSLPAITTRLVGGGGGLVTMGVQYLSYLRDMRKLKSSPYHIVWQLQRNAP